MKTIKDALKNRNEIILEKKRGGLNSLRADNCNQLLVFMGEDKTLPEEYALERQIPGAGKVAKKNRLNLRIKYWLGRTKSIEPGEIYRMMQKSKGSKNPQALFNYLLKQKLICKKSNTNQKNVNVAVKRKHTSSVLIEVQPTLFEQLQKKSERKESM